MSFDKIFNDCFFTRISCQGQVLTRFLSKTGFDKILVNISQTGMFKDMKMCMKDVNNNRFKTNNRMSQYQSSSS
jgi:hypothetical protein